MAAWDVSNLKRCSKIPMNADIRYKAISEQFKPNHPGNIGQYKSLTYKNVSNTYKEK